MNFAAYQSAAFRNDLMRSAGALVGIAQGLLADGHINDQEVTFLNAWLANNTAISTTWPGNIIHEKLKRALEDGHISDEEREHLATTLQQLVGGTLEELADAAHVTGLAFDDVADIEFDNRKFCLTGEFVFGPRSVCAAAIERRGGTTTASVNKKIDYVIVGGFGSVEWKHGSFGTKLEKALEYRQQGANLRIVHEDTWASALSRATAG